MRTRRLWLFGFALVAAAVLMAAPMASAGFSSPRAAVQDPPRPPGPPQPPPPLGGGPRGIAHLVTALDLTSAQVEQVKALEETERSSSKTHMEKMREADEGIKAIIESGSFDEAAVRELASGAGAAMVEMRVISARTEAAIYQLLTAEQRTRLAELEKAPKRPGR
jgi:Spy/CpxP family protein refolding chaperone